MGAESPGILQGTGAAPHYRVHGRIGKGGMAVVHLGTMVSPAGERRVAIKRLLGQSEVDEEGKERIIAEARLVFQLTHANICQVLDLGVGEGGTFIVMEFVNGLDLRALLAELRRQGGKLEVPCAIHVAREIAQALDYAHRRTDARGQPLHLVHGDVAPQNVLVSREGEVKLTDFGIARALRAHAPGNQLRGGTPGFMAPEALLRSVDHRADIYSLGVVLYSALGGAPPHKVGVDLKELSLRRPELSSELLSIIERATALRREDRYLSADELERALAFHLARRHPSFTRRTLADVVCEHSGIEIDLDVEVPEAQGTLVSIAQHQDLFASPTTGSMEAAEATPTERAEPADTVVGPAAPSPAPPETAARPQGTRRFEGDSRLSRRLLVGGLGLVAATLLGWVGYRLRERADPAVSAPPVAPAPPVSVGSSSVALAPSAPVSPVAVAAPVGTPVAAAAEVPSSATTRRAPSSPERRRAAATGIGYLTVSSVPWGAVFVDGKRVAEQTPAYRIPVAAGRHVVTVASPERPRRAPAQKVVVEAGANRVVGFQW